MDDKLFGILAEAHARAMKGKGYERHGGADISFFDQPIFTIPKALRCSSSPMLFQAVKKIYESRRLSTFDARRELLDAIVYIACAIIYDTELDKSEK